jgi:uncharacterized protein
MATADLARAPVVSGQGRGAFLARTYAHLLAAVAAFVIFEVVLFRSGLAEPIARAFLRTHWLVVLGGYVLCAWLFSRLAYSITSIPAQYLGLLAYVAVEGVICVPLLVVADRFAPGLIQVAATMTLMGLSSVSWIVFRTRHDFSFLEPFLTWAGIMALILVFIACVFGLHLGLWFTAAVVLVAGGSILHETSRVLLHFPDDYCVGAALELFASIVLLFWNVLESVGEAAFGWTDGAGEAVADGLVDGLL